MLLAVNTTLQILALRSLMLDTNITGTERPLDAYIIPLADAHAGSRIASCDQRLRYISGFSGSAGSAIVTLVQGLLWTDGRYFTQANEELDQNWQLMRDGLPDTPSPGTFLNRNLSRGSVIGVDPTLYSKTDWDTLQSELKIGGQELVPVESNLVDLVWANTRPPCPTDEVFHLELNFTGRITSEKLIDIRAEMQTEGADAVVISELDEIAWLLNLRGSDLDAASVFISYAIILRDGFHLFINPAKLTEPVRDAIVNDGGEIHPYEDVVDKLSEIVNATTGRIWFSTRCNYALVRRSPSSRQLIKLTPLALLKAVKNNVEAEGMRTALIKDAAAIIRFLAWLEDALVVRQENVTELTVVDKLLDYRRENPNFLSLSFNTISASGSNAAIIHYRPTPESNAQLSTSQMFLLDSGGIYREGSTDITRTLHFGTPTDFQRDCYTRVLKGQIAIVNSKFPNKIRASRLDSFARRALWNVGLDYNHGTGHGIGHALNVHEGPSYIRNYYIPDDQGLRVNMFTSNEPGFYLEGQFGIRLENIIRVMNTTLENNFGNQGFLGFEDLTFVPYQHKLIKTELLTPEEIAYLNAYQEKTRNIVGDYLRSTHPQDPGYDWLIKETPPFVLSHNQEL